MVSHVELRTHFRAAKNTLLKTEKPIFCFVFMVYLFFQNFYNLNYYEYVNAYLHKYLTLSKTITLIKSAHFTENAAQNQKNI